MKAFVLGAGLMGRAVVYDLASSREVRQIIVGDFDRARAGEVANSFGRGKAKAVFADVRETAHLAKLLRGSDIVLNCTQYNWNLDVMRAALVARIHYMDLGGLYYMTRKQFSLDGAFRRIGRLAIPGMGGAPGITNVMARQLCDSFERPDSIRVYNAGADRQKYSGPVAFSFSIATILDELTMAPIHFQDGRFVKKPMFSEPEEGTFPHPIGKIVLRHSIHSELGTLAKSFRKAGVHEVFFKINYPPEMVNLVRNLSEARFTSREPLDVNGARVTPREVLLALLRKHAPRKPPLDVEALRVVVSGRNKGKKSAAAMEMWAENTKRPLLSAVARDTGFPCSVAAIMHWRGEISGAGVMAPENVVPPQPFFNELKRRGFIFRRWNFRM